MRTVIRALCLAIPLIVLSYVLSGQTPEQLVRMVENSRSEYYFGHGYDDDYEHAVQKAKAQLVGDIALYIKSSTTGIVSTETGVSMEERIHTYTNMAQLREVETIVLSTEPLFHVFCYLGKSSVQQMFAERQQKVMDYFDEARRAEQKRMMAEALRYYYWSMLVLRTLPDGNSVTFLDESGQYQKMLLWLNRHIPELLDNIHFETLAVTGDEQWKQVEVAVSYLGQPVADCEYRYWTGRGYSQPVRAKDGRGIAEFSEVPAQLQFYVEYAFADDARNIDPELRDIVEMEGKPSWRNNAHTFPSSVSASVATSVATSVAAPVKGTASWIDNHNVIQQLTKRESDSCVYIMNGVENAIATHSHESCASFFTMEGMQMFNAMMKNGNASIVGKPDWEFVRIGDEILCKGLTVSLRYPRSGKTIVENVEFCIDAKLFKVNSLSYRLNREAEADIMSDVKKWSMNSRLQLMRFLQDYQTAYALKRADYLESIFSDDALIIVGKEVKRAPDIENRISLANPKQYQYVRKTKSEFLADLRRVFASTEFVNLQLKDNEILKLPDKEIYCIQIRQIYTSNSYADEGYLFLLLDLRDAEKPVIHVRTWQPGKDPEFGLVDGSWFTIN